ncbi:WD40-repeat-containing domain protein [Lineolata rhizophorae]|uniref:WD40-repeat-containing domain protein n=1 Tax=Lineolata rhizophorae TaxID=578093 RepID=A0A6A6NWJ5_9PEZI|nr:WD40-repeat-containing domain protein [Lineolata rhizophorae]
MKTDYRFSTLLGTVFSRGNLLFSPDGTCLISPVGNRISVFDLVKYVSLPATVLVVRDLNYHRNKSHTLPLAHRRNISRLTLTPRGNVLLSVDEDGHAILSHLERQVVLYRFSFKSAVSALAFSPCGSYFAAGVGRQVEVWHTPSEPSLNPGGELEFAPFVRHRVYVGHYDTIQSVEWSSDSRFFLSSSQDLTARIWSLNPMDGFEPTTLVGHRQAVRGAWFSKDQETIYTISKDGALFEWAYMARPGREERNGDANDMRWRIAQRHYFMQSNAHLTCATFHAQSNLVVAGFSNGLFGIYELPEFITIQTLSISQNDIDFVSINKTGEWFAFGASKLGQLLVWEWQSESYILKQQGHFDSMNAISYSPDGQRIITAADDGKVKVWDTRSGFCIVTFTEHTGGVTACEVAKRGNVLFTASLDGSVRAWDLIRYRNFRTFTAPSHLSFSSLAVDPSGEVVCAGSLDSFDIHIWSVQTGQLLDQLSGHEGPVSSLAFAPDSSALVSGSWDHTVRIWNVFGRTQTSEPLQLQADVLCVAFRPDSKQIAVSTLDGQLTFWYVSEATQQGGFDARRDVSGGRKMSDRRTAASVAGTKYFSTITYSADGQCVLAAGNSKHICLYDVDSGVLVKKFTVSINLSLDGTQEFLNSKLLTEAGPRGLIDEQAGASDPENRMERTLPGSTRGDAAARRTRPEVRVSAVSFAPTARSFCASSTEGLLVYSLDSTAAAFDPFDLSVDVTPANTIYVLESEHDYLRALCMAFRLDNKSLVRRCLEGTPLASINIVVRSLPRVYLARTLRFVGQQAEETPHLEFCLLWIEALLRHHGRWMKDNRIEVEAEIRAVQRAVSRIQRDLENLGRSNVYAIDFLLSKPVETKESSSETGGDLQAILGLKGASNGIEDENMDDAEGSEAEWMGID